MKKTYSLIVPTYNEKDNIIPFLMSLAEKNALNSLCRIIFVDDNSPDGTSEYIKKQTLDNIDIICAHRINRSGLSSAVVEGIMLADTEYVAVMDVDGQHKASDLEKMIDETERNNFDLVIGSRFLLSNKVDNHEGFRHQISTWGNKITRRLLRREMNDALTGFFVIRRQLFLEVVAKLKSNGFKILFDILFQLRDRQVSMKEVQIEFSPRKFGESKLDAAVMLDFADQVIQMVTYNLMPPKFTLFCIVGFSGVAVNYAVLSLSLFAAGLSFVTAQILAALASMFSNYHLNNLLTFRRNRKHGSFYFTGLIKFLIGCSVGAIANVGIASYLVNANETWWLSSLAGIIVSIIFNFSLARFIVWK